MLDNPRYGINNLALPNKTIIHDQAFTNDMVLFLEVQWKSRMGKGGVASFFPHIKS
jgi:hypothetical protein